MGTPATSAESKLKGLSIVWEMVMLFLSVYALAAIMMTYFGQVGAEVQEGRRVRADAEEDHVPEGRPAGEPHHDLHGMTEAG